MRKQVYFERAIFLSWYCSRADCKFCYMSTQNIKDPQKSRRDPAAVLAEALISKACNWKIEFISGGYECHKLEEISQILKNICQITSQKQWLNIGSLTNNEIKALIPHIKGVSASLECPNPELRKKLCPSKPLTSMLKTLEETRSKNLLTSITIIIGLGESKQDFKLLKDFITKHKLDRITFYALKPVKGTIYENSKGPTTEEYLWWISQTRKAFPNLEIIAGTTPRRYNEVGQLLKAGATAFTKFPATKMFGTQAAKEIEQQVKEAGFTMESTLTKLPDVDWDEEIDKLDLDEDLKKRMKVKLKLYLDRMRKNIEENN